MDYELAGVSRLSVLAAGPSTSGSGWRDQNGIYRASQSCRELKDTLSALLEHRVIWPQPNLGDSRHGGCFGGLRLVRRSAHNR
jgi:hypothetical protein